jgi:hypothetical protein
LDGEFIPDAVLDLQAGVKVAIEVVASHDIDGLKLAAMQQEGIQVLRVDARLIRSAMDAFPSLRGNLVDLVGRAGPWQTWPYIKPAPAQTELDLRPRAWWQRWLCTPLVRQTHPQRNNIEL